MEVMVAPKNRKNMIDCGILLKVRRIHTHYSRQVLFDTFEHYKKEL